MATHNAYTPCCSTVNKGTWLPLYGANGYKKGCGMERLGLSVCKDKYLITGAFIYISLVGFSYSATLSMVKLSYNIWNVQIHLKEKNKMPSTLCSQLGLIVNH